MEEKLELMFGGIPILTSLDDLIDERAKNLIRAYNLEFNEILPYCEELKDEEKAKSVIEINPDKKGVPINIHEIYKKKYASMAAIFYELTKREAYFLPVTKEYFRVTRDKVDDFVITDFSEAIQIKIVERKTDIDGCEQSGMFCENFLREIEKDQYEYLSNI